MAVFVFMCKENSMHSVGTPMLWGGFAVVVLIMLAIDLFLQGVAARTA
jgi:hypothetical protein